MNKKAHIVIGLGFGDEGKGLTTDYLCRTHENPLVIRFNGGQQAGHTVVKEDGSRHVFSNFGAGTLRGTPTFWSRFCTFAPTNLLKEYEALKQVINSYLGFPQIYVDNLCPVTTHYDVLYNRILETERGDARHGSCGMGFGATVERHTLSHARLYAQDLLFPNIISLKLNAIRAYYQKKIKAETAFDFDALEHDKEDERFVKMVAEMQNMEGLNIDFTSENEFFSKENAFKTYIFEGAQGILLDMDFGFFPHVTRSNTTSKNAFDIIKRNNLTEDITVNYITRAYQTRHGAGPMTNENIPLSILGNENETNQFNAFQEAFKAAPLDIDLLQYALRCDADFANGAKKHLVLTCLDQVNPKAVVFTEKQTVYKEAYQKIIHRLGFDEKDCLLSFSDKGDLCFSLDAVFIN
jgi:adenylosuccinate synthase